MGNCFGKRDPPERLQEGDSSPMRGWSMFSKSVSMKGAKVMDKSSSFTAKVGRAVSWKNLMKKGHRAAVQGIVDENVSLPSYPKSDADRALLHSVMRENDLFKLLNDETFEKILDTMESIKFEAGKDIIKQGDSNAEQFFVIQSGSCAVHVTEAGGASKKMLTYAAGQCFGDMALMYSAPRAATVSTLEPTVVWSMKRQHYLILKRKFFEQVHQDKLDLLDRVPSFQILDPSQLEMLIDTMESVSFPEGHQIITQGDKGQDFFIISEGTVSIKVCGKLVNRLSVGSFFGERALVKDEVRAADVIAVENVKCLKLGRKQFIEILGPMENLWKVAQLTAVPLLANLEESHLMTLLPVLEEIKFQANEVVFNKGESGDMLYLISEGSVNVIDPDDGGAVIANLHRGGYFGEKSLLHHEVRAATVICEADCTMMCLKRSVLEKHIGNLNELRCLWREGILDAVPIFKALSQEQLCALARSLVPKTIQDQEPIVTRGESGDTFFLIETGKVDVYAADGFNVVATLKEGSFFGERSLITNEVRNATVLAHGVVNVLMVNRATFMDLLGDSKALFHEILEQRAAQEAELKVSMKDIQTVAVLGVGAFGRVTLVKCQKALYALKAINKKLVIEKNMLKHIEREKNIMKELNSPFTVNLVGTTQDQDHIYMMMERVMGGEFYYFLRNLERHLHEHHARFYAACVIVGVAHIHSKGYMFRDLKPENLLLDSHGYLKITDYGFAKKLEKGKSYTLCGTPDYLAPEIIQQTGHTHAVDWWAVGVLIYEICTRTTPFDDTDQLKTLFNINNLAINWQPTTHLTVQAVDIMKKFLVKNPARRLGSIKGGVDKIKSHPWFVGFDWTALENRTMPAPYVPKLSSGMDTRMFEQLPDDVHVPGDDVEYSKETLAMASNQDTFADW